MDDADAAIRRAYADLAARDEPHIAGRHVREAGASFGYSEDDLDTAPSGANLGLGCGNPLGVGLAQEGDVVIDLGSGAGFDCFLAAQRVGPNGRVIGIDATPEMLARARTNADAGGYETVEFRHGDLRDLPVEDASADLVISNCVISLVPDRDRVYREAYRVLRAGGRLAVADTIVTEPVSRGLIDAISTAQATWLTASGTPEQYVETVAGAGFEDVRIVEQKAYPPELAFEDSLVEEMISVGVPPEAIERARHAMLSITVTGMKPDRSPAPGPSDPG